MSVSAKQFAYLQEMGIELWQRKTLVTAKPLPKEETVNTNDDSVLECSLEQLTQNHIFNDLTQAMLLSNQDIIEHQHCLSCKTFKWQFHRSENIAYVDGTLQTPSIDKLMANAATKKRLWNVITQHILQAQ